MSLPEFKCNICIKLYASYKSLWLHNKKFHKNEIINPTKINTIVNKIITNPNKIITSPNEIITSSNEIITSSNEIIQITNDIIKNPIIPIMNEIITTKPNEIINKLKCDYCNKIFATRQSKSEHKRKSCKLNTNNITNIITNTITNTNTNTNEIIELKKENEKIKNSLKELKELLLKNCKIHPKTLQKINKNLINSQNNTINNTIINKTYVNFYNPIDYKILSENEILNILNRCCNSLEESIKTIHFNKKLPEYNNILITNLKDNNAYIFNGIKFCAASKNEIIEELITNHMDEIEISAKEYENKLSSTKLKHLNKFIETINDDEKLYFHENLKKKFSNYKIYKSELIKKLIYNYSDSKLLEKLKTMELANKIFN